MNHRLQAGLTQAGTLAGVGLIAGALVAWGSLLLAGEQPQDVAAVGARFFLGLAGLLPAVLLFYTYANQEPSQQPQLYQQRNDRLVMLLVAATAGALAASLFYSLAVVYVPAIIGGLDPVAMQESYFPLIGLGRVLVVLVASLLAAVLLALFGRR